MLLSDPSREAGHLGLMRCAGGQGQRDLVIKRCQDYRRILKHELGLTPSPEASALYAQLVQS